MVIWLLLSASSASATTSSFLVPGAEAAGPQAHEDRANELAEGSRVDWIQFLFLTVPQVMVVQGAPGQAHTLRCLVVIQQPLQLKTHTEEAVSPGQYILLCDSHLARNEEQQCSLLWYQRTEQTSHTHTHIHHMITYLRRLKNRRRRCTWQAVRLAPKQVTTAWGMADWVNTRISEVLVILLDKSPRQSILGGRHGHNSVCIIVMRKEFS